MATVKSPTAPDELEDFLSDEGKVKSMLADGTFADHVKNYAQSVANKDRDLTAQVNEQVQIGIAEFMKASGADVKKVDFDPKAIKAAGPSQNLDNPRASGAPLNGLFPDFYSYLQAVWTKGNKTQEVKDKLQTIMDYSETVPAEGGFLVPEEFRSQLMRLMLPNQVVRPRATVIPMANPRVHVPKIDETSRVSSVFGGVVVYRSAEGAELVESAAAFASTKLDVTKQTALSHVPNELIRDWGAFGAFMDATLPSALGFYEDVDFLTGNGAGAPLGALNTGNTALVAVTRHSASHIVWEDVIAMYARLLPQSIPNAVWLAGQDSFVELATMALTVGTGGSAVWLTDGRSVPQLTLLGLPVILDADKAPSALGTIGDLSLVDFSFYLVGDYQTFSVDTSEHVKFTSDKTTYRLIARNDGRPWLDQPLTPRNNSATLSPFVQLAT